MICQVWNFSIISVLALTISNILLTIRLLHKPDCPNVVDTKIAPVAITRFPAPLHPDIVISSSDCGGGGDDNTIDEFAELGNHSHRLVFDRLNLLRGRWDASRQYKYFDFAAVGNRYDDLTKKYKVCLATQSSLERLYSLVSVASHWTGPISLAVYVAGDDELYLLQLYLSYLQNCFASIRDAVTIHLAYPIKRAPKTVRKFLKSDYSNFVCDQPELTLKKLMKFRTTETIKWRLKNAYPQNHLRNLARKGCQNDYIFLTDIDIIPSINFTDNLDKFLRKSQCSSQSKCAYVVPTYEIDNRAKFPQTKADLLRLSKRGLARPFHHKVFIYNQYATNFSRWESNVGSPQDDTTISHNVTNFEFLYEPFYVSTDSVPPHDERFLGYGFTRNTQVYEMFVAGYQFHVLTPIFTCHWGLQNKKSRPAWRERQNNLNRKQFEVFKKEIYARYHRDPLQMLQPKKAPEIKPKVKP
ncbi:beta-1,4-glucuronyltransferase 1 isoform X2 [Sitodiplosis mosellana]|uniref:beta-1,4-glucuronyltransferase 1 isoform X2 n=1 Tax=Sitodiplosis mosellana TaxID=263140 RepID=UPI0024451893|nr:beta-1,4-glucuronyltransferase 1 isoform X2 [Sitodiplosis mosellana]